MSNDSHNESEDTMQAPRADATTPAESAGAEFLARQRAHDRTHMAVLDRVITHYSPTPNTTGPAWFRVSVCGVETRIGDFARAGCSNLEHVTCDACLALATTTTARAGGTGRA